MGEFFSDGLNGSHIEYNLEIVGAQDFPKFSDFGQKIHDNSTSAHLFRLIDLNNDGWLDWIDSHGKLYHGMDGNFTLGHDFSYSGVVEVGDFDQDGLIDVFFGKWNDPDKIFFGDASNSYTRQLILTGPDYPESDSIALDFDSDGDLDIVLAHTRGVNGGEY